MYKRQIQTNGICLDEEWASFFKANSFLVGLSLDGTQENHDLYRLDAAGPVSYTHLDVYKRQGWCSSDSWEMPPAMAASRKWRTTALPALIWNAAC